MTEQEHQEIVDRLRAVGQESVPRVVAAAHLRAMDGLGGSARRTRHSWRVAVAAAAAVVVLGMGTAAVALVGNSGAPPQQVAAAAPPDGLFGNISGDDPCVGPPPFAGVEPESEEAREEEADEFRAQREQCPTDEEDAEDETAEGSVVDPFPDDPCKGPPPFAGSVPESGEQRAEEAAEFAAEREQCPADGSTTTTPPANGADSNN
jgi:hypothetical protein